MNTFVKKLVACSLAAALIIGCAGCASSAGQEITLATVEGTIGTEPEETVSNETVSNEAEDILVQVSSKEAVETTEPSVEGTQPSNGTKKAEGISNGNTGDSKGGTNTAKTTEPTPATKPTEPASTTKPTEPSATEPTPTTKPTEPKATEPTPTTKPTEPTPTTKPTEPAPAVHTHSWDGGTVTKAATCTAEGIMTYTCTECGDTYTESIPATDHTWVHYHEDAEGYTEVGLRCHCGWTCWQSDADAAGLNIYQYYLLFHSKQLETRDGHSYDEITRDFITKDAVDYNVCSVCGAIK